MILKTLEQALAYSYGNENTNIDSNKAITMLQELAKLGNTTAQVELAYYYDGNRGCSILPNSWFKRDEYLLKAARLESADAIEKIMDLIKYDRTMLDGIKYSKEDKDMLYQEMMGVLECLVSKGDAKAMIIMSQAITIRLDIESAVLLHAAWLNNEKLKASLYLSEVDEEFLSQLNLDGSIVWKKRFNLLQAEYVKTLESEYHQGKIINLVKFLNDPVRDYFSHKNHKKIYDYVECFYKHQAGRGASDAWIQLAYYSEDKYNSYYNKAAKLGSAVGKYAYALTLEWESDLTDRQYAEIERCYNEAAQDNHPNAVYEKGKCYYKDDPNLAKKYFLKAIELDCLEALEAIVGLTQGPPLSA